ncbi:MAG: archaeal proteasome endopeptidase complex subunit alpha [Candidatus Lokiarchaeota archaeon]|nr:archaeal proteasome endopeptidase complex subunit alpha [Candidatus Lokiarchaeota archaeon]
MGYDRGLTMFSPEGRLYQVEYALEAVKRGTLAIAFKAKDGAVLVVHKKISTKLMDPSQIHKVYLVDKHVGVAISGLHADARILTDQARLQAAYHRLSYDEDVPVATLVKKICDISQAYSQHGGVRPFGASLMFVGIDEQGPQVFTTSPSGTYFSWIAKAIGFKSDECQDYLKDNYSELKSLEQVKTFAIKTLVKFVDDELTPETVEVGVIPMKSKEFTLLDEDERKGLLAAAGKEAAKDAKAKDK